MKEDILEMQNKNKAFQKHKKNVPDSIRIWEL